MAIQRRYFPLVFAVVSACLLYPIFLIKPISWLQQGLPSPSVGAELALLRNHNAQLLQETERLKQNISSRERLPINETGGIKNTSPIRNVVVPSMCRCGNENLPVPFNVSKQIDTTNVTQPASLATGIMDKHFYIQTSQCECRQGQGEETKNAYLGIIEGQYHSRCFKKNNQTLQTSNWDAMPDFGVEKNLPLLLGVLSYKAPLSLNASLSNWEQYLNIDFAERYIQLNARCRQDDEVLAQHASMDFTITGKPDENLHPGHAIAKFCRQAEQSPHGHPNGENLLMFLEKDWHVANKDTGLWKKVINSVNSLMQRGVNYVRLKMRVTVGPKSWKCNAEGMSWSCTTAHQHRYTNLPSIIRCDWFLRYLEPFALLEDDIMISCRHDQRQKNYVDWEECMQDGRVAWTNSQWVIASYEGILFHHHEVDQ